MQAWQLQSQGRLEEAAAIYRRLIESDAGDFESLNNLGNIHRAVGESQAAVAALRQAVALRPELPMLHLNLAGALAEAAQPEESLAAVERAVALAPEELACLVELSRAHARLGGLEAALVPLETGLAKAPGHPGLLVEIGLLHAARGAYDEAAAAYREAIRRQPDFVPAYLYLGLLLEHNNQAEALAALLVEAEARRVPASELALLRAFHLRRSGDHAAALAEARRASPAVEPARRAQLIGEMADRLGDSAAAFAAFEEMNRLDASTLFAPDEAAARYRREVEGLLAVTTESRYQRWGPPAPAGERASPVFLMGFPRSGTTLLDTVLMGHSRVHVVEEKPLLQPVLDALGDSERLADLGPATLAELRDLYFAALDRLDPPGADKMVIDKMPLNIPRLGLIHRLFPDARILFVLRHPCDVVLSCFMTQFGLNYAMANFLDLGDAARLYDLVMRHWQRACAIFPLQVHEIRYERMVENLEASVQPMLAFLGLDLEEGMLDHRRTAQARGYVASASYAQVTEPVYDRARGRWTRYRGQMDAVLTLLRPWCERFGYALDDAQ